jgi:uncharacterized membrane protein
MAWTIYYLSRAILAAALGLCLFLAGLPWWAAAAAGVLAAAAFVWMAHSGRYVVARPGGIAPFRRDERTRQIADIAARATLAIGAIALAGVVLYYYARGQEAVPLEVLSVVIAAGAVTYAIADLWLRRTR